MDNLIKLPSPQMRSHTKQQLCLRTNAQHFTKRTPAQVIEIWFGAARRYTARHGRTNTVTVASPPPSWRLRGTFCRAGR